MKIHSLKMNIIFLIMLTACTETPIYKNTSTPNDNVPVIASPTTTLTKEHSTNIPSQGTISRPIFYPKVINICPETQVVKIKDLGIQSDLGLLLLPISTDAYPQVPGTPLYFSPNKGDFRVITHEKLLGYQVSPDHKWISYNKSGKSGKSTLFFISSLDGKKTWPVFELKNGLGYVVWSTSNELLIVGSQDSNDTTLQLWDYRPFVQINPFTLEQILLTDLPGRQENIGPIFYGSVNIDNRLYSLYGGLNQVNYIYDYSNNKEIKVFNWLDKIDPINFRTPIFISKDGKFFVNVPNEKGIDIAFGLDIPSASEPKTYDDVMKKVILPERLLPAKVLGLLPKSNSIFLKRDSSSSPSNTPEWFYIYDDDNEIIKDYCLGSKYPVNYAKISPDGQYIAIRSTRFGSGDDEEKNLTTVLNIKTGQVAYLEGYIFIDWGIFPNQ